MCIRDSQNRFHRGLGDHGRGPLGEAGVDYQRAGLDVAHDRGLGLGGELVVEVVDAAAEETGGVADGHGLRQVAAEQRHGLAAGHAPGLQRPRHAVHEAGQLPGGDAAFVVDECFVVGVGGQGVKDVLHV